MRKHLADYSVPMRRSVAQGITGLLLCLGVAQAAELDRQETRQAAVAAEGLSWPVTGTARSALQTAEQTAEPRTDHPLGVQTLSIELEDRKQRIRRIARVYQFDHNHQRSRLVRVDLNTGAVLQQQVVDSRHLPLNTQEVDYAMTQLLARDDLLEQLRNEQRARGIQAFGSLAELEVKAFVHQPRNPEHSCHQQRCALLSLFDQSRTVFNLEPLVRFSDGTIITP